MPERKVTFKTKDGRQVSFNVVGRENRKPRGGPRPGNPRGIRGGRRAGAGRKPQPR